MLLHPGKQWCRPLCLEDWRACLFGPLKWWFLGTWLYTCTLKSICMVWLFLNDRRRWSFEELGVPRAHKRETGVKRRLGPIGLQFFKGMRSGARAKGSRTQRLSARPAGPAAAVGAAAPAVSGREFAARLRSVAAETQRAPRRAGGARCAWACLRGAALPAPARRVAPRPSSSAPASGPAPCPRRAARGAWERSGPGVCPEPLGQPPPLPRPPPVRAADARRWNSRAPCWRPCSCSWLRRRRRCTWAAPTARAGTACGRRWRCFSRCCPARSCSSRSSSCTATSAATARSCCCCTCCNSGRSTGACGSPGPLPPTALAEGAAFREGRVAGPAPGPGRLALLLGPSVPVTRMRRDPGRVEIKLGRGVPIRFSRGALPLFSCTWPVEMAVACGWTSWNASLLWGQVGSQDWLVSWQTLEKCVG